MVVEQHQLDKTRNPERFVSLSAKDIKTNHKTTTIKRNLTQRQDNHPRKIIASHTGALLLVQLICLTVISWYSIHAVDSISAQEINTQSNRSLYSSISSGDYYYTRTREDPSHLRISEEFKNKFTNDVKYESKINGTKYEYYRASSGRYHQPLNHDDLVFETIDKMFRHRLSAFYIHHYDDDQDKRRSFDPRKVSHEACARDLLYLIDKIHLKRSQQPQPGQPTTSNGHVNYEDLMSNQLSPELSAFFDSYARQEAGLLMGNTYWTGAYDQCVTRQIFELIESVEPHQQQQVVSFNGRYCVSALKAPSWDDRIKARKESSKDYFRSEKQLNDYSKLFRLQVGICLPDSCDSTSLERHLEEIKLLSTSMLESRYANYELIDLYCLPDESSPLRQWSSSAITFVVVVTIWMSWVFLATVADVFEFVDISVLSQKPPEDGKKKVKVSRTCQLVCWFSLRANYNKIMKVSVDEETEAKPAKGGNCKPTNDQVSDATPKQQVESKPSLKVNLRFLNAFKTLVMFWIVNGHIMLLMIQTAKNILNSDALLNGLMHLLIGATFGVDLFFTMTGFLTSYLIFNSGHAYKMKPATWLYLSFHRYWRLAPMYLLSFWFSKSVAQLMGSGPLWDYGTSGITFRGLCNNESWWYPLTLTSNLHGLFEECMITSWYISCDMQFWLASPVFIYLLAKSPLSGWTATLATIAASSKLRYESVLSEKAARYDELVQPRADIFMRVSHDLPALYTHPHYRISAYLVGLLAGHFVYMIQAGKWKSLLSYDIWVKQQHLLEGVGEGLELEQPDTLKEKIGQVTDVAYELKEDKPTSEEKQPTKTDDDKTTVSEGDKTSSHVEDKQARIGKQQRAMMAKVRASRRLRSLVAYSGLFLFLLMSFASYLLHHYCPQLLLRNAKQSAAIAYSIDHLLMSIGASFIIISMCFGQWNKLGQFLSHPNWTRLSKINYALLLLQCEAIYYQVFRHDEIPNAGTKQLINILFNLLVTLYPVAFVVTLVFEYPLANIEKLLMP